ncbi:MAG: transglycosylase domain-containing protein [Pseudomonadota bacterium]
MMSLPLALFALMIAFVLVALVALFWYCKTAYFDLQPEVDRLLKRLNPSELEPPAALVKLVLRLQEDAFTHIVCRKVIVHLEGDDADAQVMQARVLLWRYLLPKRLGRKLMLALYMHFLPFEGGRGLIHGSKHYFNKTPEDLSEEECLALYVTSLAPGRCSPTRNPEELDAQCRRYAWVLRDAR